MEFSLATIQLFDQLLAEFQLPAKHPQFDLLASQISVARKEIKQYYEHPQIPEPDAQLTAREAQAKKDSNNKG